MKRSNYIGIAGSARQLLGIFLPYLPGVSFFQLVGRASGTSFCAASGLFPGVGRCAVCAGAGGVAAGNHFVPVFYGAGISRLCGHEVRTAFGPAPAAHRCVAAPSGTGGSGGRDLSSHGLAGKKPGGCP